MFNVNLPWRLKIGLVQLFIRQSKCISTHDKVQNLRGFAYKQQTCRYNNSCRRATNRVNTTVTFAQINERIEKITQHQQQYEPINHDHHVVCTPTSQYYIIVIIMHSRAGSGAVQRGPGGVVRRNVGRGLRRGLRFGLRGRRAGDRSMGGVQKVSRCERTTGREKPVLVQVRRAEAADGGRGRPHHRADHRVLAGRQGQSESVQNVFRSHPGPAGRAVARAPRARHLRVVLPVQAPTDRPYRYRGCDDTRWP